MLDKTWFTQYIFSVFDFAAIDDGGPLLAFIWKLTKSIQCGEYNGLSLLYGKEPNATLSADRCLIRDNVMSMLARFTAFSILNTGKGLYGLNRICVKVLTSTWWPTAADIKISDIPDPDAKFAAESVSIDYYVLNTAMCVLLHFLQALSFSAVTEYFG